MKKRSYFRALLCFLFVAGASLLLTPEAESVPGFARQTGMSCNTCHFQHYPSLNSVGRAFKSGGFTMVGGQSMIEGELLSIPASLNASIVLKARFKKTNGDDDTKGTNKGLVEFPDEGVLLIGGKAGEHVGFLLEAQLKAPDDSAWASFKMPVTYDFRGTNLAVIPFTTDGPGPAYAFEPLNTGAMRIQRPLEDRKAISAQQYIGTGDRPATGMAFVASNGKFFADYTLWSPAHGTSDAGPYLHYLRGGVTPTFKGWNLGAGFQVWQGNTNLSSHDAPTLTVDTSDPACPTNCPVTSTAAGIERVKANAWALDAQAQGSVGKYPLGLYVTYATAEKSDPQRDNLFNSSFNDDMTAFSVLAELGIIPGKLSIAAGYLAGDTGDATYSEQNTVTLGAIYMFRQNISFQINQTFKSGDFYDLRKNNEDKNGDRQTIVMLSAGF